ncbi:VOC family protein [Aquabacter sp. CN5-332]|uniref:VOC family protein n=1 Tax=Aquabacter sp. CN5-332 TaxID=3156608 RepID=UPI0032B45ECA
MSIATEAPLHVGKVTLVVHDLDGVSDFYQQAMGLHRISGDADTVLLGAGGMGFFELRRDAAARRSSHREAGLFHTAFLLPTRSDLGRWMRHAAGEGLKIDGAADHVVSEAIYLADPEGNGIEIYADRAPAHWTWTDGMVVMRNDRLDLQALARDGGDAPWRGFPDGAVIGHVHLQVGDLGPAEAFYAGSLGLDITCRYPGATFYSSGGYHHHIATNIWNSRGASVRSVPATGIAEVELIATPETRDIVRAKLGAGANGVARDPWGTAIAVR